MLLPMRQITRGKLCFYYTCKFGVISIKYVIMYCFNDIYWYFFNLSLLQILKYKPFRTKKMFLIYTVLQFSWVEKSKCINIYFTNVSIIYIRWNFGIFVILLEGEIAIKTSWKTFEEVKGEINSLELIVCLFVRLFVCLMVFSATFNNISIIS